MPDKKPMDTGVVAHVPPAKRKNKDRTSKADDDNYADRNHDPDLSDIYANPGVNKGKGT